MPDSNYRKAGLFKTLTYKKELDHIAGWVKEYPALETGGDLFGFWTHSGFPVVQLVLGPGSNSRHNPASFYQDKDHLIQAGQVLRERHGLQHIGEWHSHHQMGLAHPSVGDEQTVFNALRRYNFPRFLLCIANLRQDDKILGKNKYTVNIGCFLFTASSNRYKSGDWVVLPGTSPIRQDVSSTKSPNWFESPKLSSDCSWDVHETTLEASTFVSTEPIAVSDHIWYSTSQGKALLKQIFENLNNRYQKCEMYRTSAEDIYFSFENQRNDKTDKWRIDLPRDFPQSSPRMKFNCEAKVSIREWNRDSDPIEQIQQFIHRHYLGCK